MRAACCTGDRCHVSQGLRHPDIINQFVKQTMRPACSMCFRYHVRERSMYFHITNQFVITPCELRAPCVLRCHVNKGSMHPDIINWFMVTPCGFLTPNASYACEGMLNASRPTYNIQLMITPCELHAPCVYDVM